MGFNPSEWILQGYVEPQPGVPGYSGDFCCPVCGAIIQTGEVLEALPDPDDEEKKEQEQEDPIPVPVNIGLEAPEVPAEPASDLSSQPAENKTEREHFSEQYPFRRIKMDPEPGILAEPAGKPIWSPLVPVNEAVLTLRVCDEAGDIVLDRSYTPDQLAALARKGGSASYVYFKENTGMAVVATEYVPLDDLLSDAAADFGPAQKLIFDCVDGPYDKDDFSYETLSQRGIDSDGAAVPAAIALAWSEGNTDETTMSEMADKAENAGRLRFVCGMTAEEAEKKNATGSRLPNDIICITVMPIK